MPVIIRMNDEQAQQELGSLLAWLQDEPSVRQHADLKLLPSKPIPGDMSSTFEMIQLIIDSSFQIMSLAIAYAAWRDTRPSKPGVTIERDGIKVILDDADPDAVSNIIRALG
jgi:Effector Associated Constant Component 1